MKVYSVFDQEFQAYGSVLEGYDFRELFDKLASVPCPREGIAYVASVKELEDCTVFEELCTRGFGGMPIEAGYCSGTNDTLNCLEYHKSSEFNIAGDEIILMLGMVQEIDNGIYDTAKAKLFRIPAGTGVELYGTTLHYAPCGAQRDRGFRVVCILPRGTNEKEPKLEKKTMEDRMCCGRNKWLLAHPESDEAKKGMYVGLSGDNLSLAEED